MATYSIRAPDGRTYQIQGPEGATDAQVRAQVLRQFPNAGQIAQAAPPPPTPRPRAAPATPRGRRGPIPADVERGLPAVPARWAGIPRERATQIYNERRTELSRNLESIQGLSPQQRAQYLQRFDTLPQVQAIRRLAGLIPVSSRQNEIRNAARDAARERDRNAPSRNELMARSAFPGAGAAMGLLTGRQTPGERSFIGGAARSMFGIPERLAAAGARWLPSRITGNNTNLSYDELLQLSRASTDEEMGRSLGGNILGQIAGSLTSGRLLGSAIGAGATRLAATGAPIAARAGNVLQNLTTLRQGQRVRNVGRVALAGSAGGAAQAVGEGSDPVEGALVGAIAGPALHGSIQLARLGGRLVRQATRPFSSSNSRAIREVITEDPAAIEARRNELSTATGTNVPVVAALRDRDFRAVTERVLRRSPDATEVAKAHTGRYLRGFMDRMLAHVNRAGREGNAQNTSIGELAQLRQDTATELMHPIRDRTVDLTQLPLDDLERRVTRQIGGRIQGLAPRINEALRELRPRDLDGMGLDQSNVTAARRLITDWGLGRPVQATVQEMDSLRRALEAAARSAQGSNPANAMAFRNAAKIIRGFVADEVPAYGQMVDTYAAQSRILEGFETAAAGRRIADIEDDLLRSNLQTPEGRVGMKAGELFRQREAVTGRTTGAISAARDFAAEGNLTRPRAPAGMQDAARPGTITENLGDAPAAGLAQASQAETRVLDRVLNTEKVNALARDEGGALSPEEIVYGAFLGNALSSTKARFLASLLNKLPHGINRRVANNLADMLFSQDPAKTAQAMRALQRAGLTERAVTGLMRNSLPVSIAVGALAGGRGAPSEGAPSSNADAPSVAADLGEEPDQDPAQELPEELRGAPQPIIAGNLPLDIQYQVENEDGSVSTVRTISIGTDQGEVLIPTVIDGRVVSDEEAIQHFEETGENFGTFSTPEEADAYAEALHNYHDRTLTENGRRNVPVASGDSPYADVLQTIYDSENPELLDLVSRVRNQESGGNQFDRQGRPLESDAGAIGVMQVMPDTGPIAAELAGVPWDPQAYRNDAAYNEILGIAYLSEQLRRYDGDVELALAAYNAGPGRADNYAAGRSRLPRETQDYLASIM